MYEYCAEHGIPYKKIGKLVVATAVDEVPKLEGLLRCGVENGVEGLRMLDGSEAMRMEPELRCVKALFSPESGIVDSHSFMLSLVGEAENSRTTFCYNTTVVGGHVEDNCLRLHIFESNELENHVGNSQLLPQLILVPKLVINSAGLSALPLAKRFHGLNHGVIPTPYYARGCYFTLSNTKIPPFGRLIYPIPEVGGLGVHVTLDLNGLVKFGPDVEWIVGVDDVSSFFNRYDYTVNPDRSGNFYPEIRKYFPNLKHSSLEPGYSGIRPKLSGPEKTSDFVIQGEDIHGVPQLVNLLGIESPGLTASLAIAEYVASRFSR